MRQHKYSSLYNPMCGTNPTCQTDLLTPSILVTIVFSLLFPLLFIFIKTNKRKFILCLCLLINRWHFTCLLWLFFDIFVFFCCILLYSILKINYFADATVMAAMADNRTDFYAFITPAIHFETHSL